MAGRDLIRHTAMWKDDGSIVIQVGDVLFKPHRSVLAAESEIFSGMFEAVAPGSDGTEEKPLVLQEVEAPAFACLLAMIYTPWSEKRSAMTTEDYIAVLRLAHKLRFTGVHEIVSDLLPPRLSIEQRLQLAISDAGVDQWGQLAFTELVLAVDVEGTGQLPTEIWIRIYRARLQVIRARAALTRTPGVTICPTAKYLTDIFLPHSIAGLGMALNLVGTCTRTSGRCDAHVLGDGMLDVIERAWADV
ncbi:hypothetical protein BKA62DRAFT_490585 [Auriculariales sp. MPI-PUGE-AT-0066]|nr:hypothetical protein BKA62DRAFT_490585 [Auriculariales sp. MPI-PUGE-AT-0066]